MKKLLAIMLTLAMMMGLCSVAFAAVTQEDVVGVWNVDVAAMMAAMGSDDAEMEAMLPFLSMMNCTMEFTADGTYALVTAFMGEEDRQEGTYAITDGKIVMDGSEGVEITLENDVLTITEGSMAMTMTRATGEKEEVSEEDQLAALMALLGTLDDGSDPVDPAVTDAPAEEAGKLEIVEETDLFITGWSNREYVYAKVENTGNATIEVDDMLLKVYDEAGNEMASKEYGNAYACYLKPGEYTYVTMNADISDGVPASYTLEVTGDDHLYYENKRYPVKTELAMNVEDGFRVKNYMYATVTNDTEETVYDVEVVMVLLDTEGEIVYVDDETLYGLGILPGTSVMVRSEIDDDFVEYYNNNNVKLGSVDAIAFTEVELPMEW